MNLKFCADYWGVIAQQQITYHVFKGTKRRCQCGQDKWPKGL